MSKEDLIKDLPIEIIDEIESRCKVELEYIGEGYNGYYDPEDPDDEPLIRFSVYSREFGTDHWEAVDDASYCTQIPATSHLEKLKAIAQSILAEVVDPVLSDESIKRLCERLSWLG